MMDEDETWLEEMLMCSVCQDILKDPRLLPCGHCLCLDCLENLKDQATEMQFVCPDCRSHFDERDGHWVQKSYALSNIAENFRVNKTRREKQTRSVHCDCCQKKETPAVKTCLKCEVSLCTEHVRDHLELPVFTGHPLVQPLGDLLDRKCSQHKDQVLRYYCNSSRRYICNICALELKQLNAATEASTVLRRQLTEYMDQNFQILRQQITESTDLRRNKQKVKPAYSSLNGVTVVLLFLWFIVLYYAYNYSLENQTLTEALEKQQSRVHHIYSTVAELMVDHRMKTQKRPETEDEGTLLSDLDIVSHFIGASPNLPTAERLKTQLEYPKSDFDEAPQVLPTECLSSGTHVWEVEIEGPWNIGVSYRSIQDSSSTSGDPTESWSLTHSGTGKLYAVHNNRKTALSETLRSSRITVAVNFKAGSITFSAVDSTVTQLHEFKTELTRPVCLWRRPAELLLSELQE
ncbi:E3 ubiquitin/ISG15 ligase TRIM25-like [Acanthochromis polyacanthus]|uniref:E3 ubiquitin/ISG15 ligase TRIM25-like n=1 Tax=Acanthochromis polyacanthus TaxID=80966 RepID=A0A3Q1HNS1_9TELE|nr:E3 ubiquitin/ISG15 ligase TRIM25-like [Acanthochromis polyacanthus]XP_022052861.1 E3 ubiquitin/ISG15 ligase TRIM25-like [Acanthochromis polyacanthus]